MMASLASTGFSTFFLCTPSHKIINPKLQVNWQSRGLHIVASQRNARSGKI